MRFLLSRNQIFTYLLNSHMMRTKLYIIGCMIGGLLLAGCASNPSSSQDPLEPLNRRIFAFNETVDQVLLKPAAQGYRYVTPSIVRKGVRNALRNFNEPVTVANALLQGDFDHFLASSWRFILNTTFGLGGMYDFAGEYAGLTYRQEDFGQTLAVWTGEDESTYVMLPLLGPSTTRDSIGFIVDIFLNPFFFTVDDQEFTIAVIAAQGLSQREQLIEPIEEIYDTSFDPYASFRSIYLQRRQSLIENRRTAGNALSLE